MEVIELRPEEVQLLRNYFQSSPIALIRLKAQAVIMRHNGVGARAIAGSLFRDERTIGRWLSDFNDRRMGSIFSGMAENEHASKLTRAQKEEIKVVVGQPPSATGIPTEFWDVPKLKAYVRAEYGVVYESNASYHFLLKFSGLGFKYPDKRSPRRDEAQIATRIAEVKAEIAPLLTDRTWIVFASDETRVQLEAEIRRAWLVKGHRTIVKTERSTEHQNYLGFLDQQSGRCHLFEIERGKQEFIIPVLESLLHHYPDKNVCVLWDNATCHKGKLLRESLKKGNTLARLHLIALPPYAPDLNPIEHVWQVAKNTIANKSNLPFVAIKNAFRNTIVRRSFPYRL